LYKVLVTGGCGFIGSHIVSKLVDKGFKVIIIDNLSSGSLDNIRGLDVNFYHADISNHQTVEEIFYKDKPDFVIHQAAQTNVQKSISNVMNDAEINILGTIKLLELSKKYNVQKFIFASSAAVYGEPKQIPIDVIHPLNPINPYGLSKWTSEKYIQLMASMSNLDYTILRYSNVYGPKQRSDIEGGVVSIFINSLKQGKNINIYGDGNQIRDFIFVEDVADANIQALFKGSKEILNVSTQTSTTINEIYRLLNDLHHINNNPIYENARHGDILISILGNTKTKNILDWEPLHSFREGLYKTIYNN